MTASQDLTDVVACEQALLDQSVRSSADRLRQLIHPDFVEYGASGRVWDRDAMIAALLATPAVSGPASDFHPVALADDVVLLTYRIHGPRPSLRSSVWINHPDFGWRIRFHQGTALS